MSAPAALVTGASAGIGAAFARALAARGLPVVLTARDAGRLHRLARELADRHGIHAMVLPADLAAPGAAAHIAGTLAERGVEIGWLVNNAGYGLPGTYDESPWEAHAAFLRVMVEAPLELVWRLLPAMRARGAGRIVNVASLAGLAPAPAGHTLYAASKAMLIKASEALAAENLDRGVHVTALCPGFTRSEFHDRTGTRAQVDRLPGFLWQEADAVAAEGIAAVEAGRAVHVTGRVNRALRRLVALTPDALAHRVAQRQARHFRRGRG